MKAIALLFFVQTSIAWGQVSDPGKLWQTFVADETDGRLKFSFEERTREEVRTGNNFGKDVNLENALVRTRVGASVRVTNWLTVSAMGQDSRAPFYFAGAPATVRDTMDLQEGYVQFGASQKIGFGAEFGRKMVTYGEGRLIGIPNWSNLSRTYDNASLYYRSPAMDLEVLMVSPVKIQAESFNQPNFGDRVVGTYDTFRKLIPNGALDGYFLRHDQNRIGGFAAAGRLATNTFGGRAYGRLPLRLKYNAEAALQNGNLGVKSHTGQAWVASLARDFTVAGKSTQFFVEYKYASGTREPAPGKDGTFDQLYAANHDRFGQTDLFGWKNLEDFRVLETVNVTKAFSITLMYNDWWLASVKDSLYNSSGKSIAVSSKGIAGRHVGREGDVFGVYRLGPYQFGLGFAHVFAGEFLKATTPGVNTRYLYVFQSYSF